jgi:hypothetical protein
MKPGVIHKEIPAFDVLIPTASTSRFVEEAVASAASQRISKKIYIIENNTGDLGYREYLRDLARRYDANYILFEDRLSMFSNWERCMRVGTAKWIAFLHDDDVWHPAYLQDVSRNLAEADVVFYEYAFFRGQPPKLKVGLNADCLTCRTREELLTKIVASRFHICAMVFRREKKLKFSDEFRYYGDQNAFLECVLRDRALRVRFLTNVQPNLIRTHPSQGTWQPGVAISASREDVVNYRIFVKQIASEALDLAIIADRLTKYMDDGILARFISMTCFSQPYWANLRLSWLILARKRSMRFTAQTLARLLFQKIVWGAKRHLKGLTRSHG